jgi:DNA polymerase/3'-5' exonuclease PolX
MDIKTATQLSNEICSSLAGVARAQVAGSVRRQKENVKDIEIVAIVNSWDDLFDSLTPFGQFIKPGVPDIIPWPPKHNSKYVRMLLNDGLKLDFFVANPENWGGLFMMRTGSGVGPDGNPFNGFTPRMFMRWKQVSNGGKMVGCMPTLPDGRSVIVHEEEEFFQLLGVKWTPPQDRISGSSIKKIPGYVLDLTKWTLTK